MMFCLMVYFFVFPLLGFNLCTTMYFRFFRTSTGCPQNSIILEQGLWE